jgi:hypothetical protein
MYFPVDQNGQFSSKKKTIWIAKNFLTDVKATRTRRGNFYKVVQDQHSLLCALSTADSLSCSKSIWLIGRITIFQGQHYSSCSKAGGCRAAQLLEGFHRNLLIISWVT